MKLQSKIVGTVLVLFIEIIAGYFIISAFIDNENKHVLNGQNTAIDNIVSGFEQIQRSITSAILRDAAIFRLNGKLLTPEDYRTFLQADNDVLSNAIHSQRWIPRISSAERAVYEQFYRNYYDSNFTIRSILFDPITRSFDISPIGNKTEYYPFTLSEPPFTVTLMGGDFSESHAGGFQLLNTIEANRLITVSSRISLLVDNPQTDYGVYVRHTVRTDLPQVPNPNTMVDPPPNNTVIIGQVIILIRPSVLLKADSDFLGISRTNYKLAIIDQTQGNIIYTEPQIDPLASMDVYSGWLQRRYQFYDREYQILITFNDDFNSQFRDDTDTIITISYILIALLIDISLCYLIRSHILALEAKSRNIYKQILSYVNHELRNPLVPIIGLVDLAIDDLRELSQTNAGIDLDTIISNLHTVQGHTELMKYIIDDVLTYRKIKEGKVQVKMRPVQIGPTVKLLQKTLKAKVTENPDVEFKLDIDEDLWIDIDPFRLNQIILNYINNSIKCTNTGFIKLTIKRCDDQVCIEVEDTGCGVTEDMHHRLFQELSQDTQYSEKGTGLGLYIVKQLAHLMNGKVGHKNRPDGTGAVFYAIFPLGRKQDTRHSIETEI